MRQNQTMAAFDPTVLTPHDESKARLNTAILIGVFFVLLAVYPLLAGAQYTGSSDLHGTIEMVGALCGLMYYRNATEKE